MRGIIAVDFDGTLCEDRFPEIGAANHELIQRLIDLRQQGWKLILWTCRNGSELREAVSFCGQHSLEFDAVNDNVDEVIERYGGDSRKIYADLYIDDRARQPGAVQI